VTNWNKFQNERCIVNLTVSVRFILGRDIIMQLLSLSLKSCVQTLIIIILTMQIQKKTRACATSWTKIEQWKTSKTTERFKMTIKLQHIAKISACLGSGHSESMIWGV
jgi:hypothetical protein